MDAFSTELNSLLVETFNNILKVEEKIIQHNNEIPLTVSELHLIEAISNCEEDNTIRQIAKVLGITMSSVTIGVNKLIEKGFVDKVKSEGDKRSVHITLTTQGEKMAEYHSFFHMQMVENISKEMSQDEKNALMTGMKKLSSFFSNAKIK